MGTNAILYAAVMPDTSTTLITSPASTTTKITYAEACNTTANLATVSFFYGSLQIVKEMVIPPGETVSVLPILGMVLAAPKHCRFLRIQASAKVLRRIKYLPMMLLSIGLADRFAWFLCLDFGRAFGMHTSRQSRRDGATLSRTANLFWPSFGNKEIQA